MEVEVKAKVKSLFEIEKRLIASGARLVKSVVQKADYYAPPWKQNLDTPGSFLLRVRSEGNKTFLTLKKLSKDNGARIEHETLVENARETTKILSEAGFKKIASVNKTRREYALGKVHYCLDDVKNLGKFVEVEEFSSNARRTLKRLEKLLHSLGLKNTTKKAYVKMMMGKKKSRRW